LRAALRKTLSNEGRAEIDSRHLAKSTRLLVCSVDPNLGLRN